MTKVIYLLTVMNIMKVINNHIQKSLYLLKKEEREREREIEGGGIVWYGMVLRLGLKACLLACLLACKIADIVFKHFQVGPPEITI